MINCFHTLKLATSKVVNIVIVFEQLLLTAISIQVVTTVSVILPVHKICVKY